MIGKFAVAVMTSAAGLTPLSAEVFVLANTQTGHVVIRGNTPDAATQVHQEAKGIRDTGWVQIFGDDASGWAAISCVAQGGRYHFFLASGHPDAPAAAKLAKAAAERFMTTNGGGRLVFMCGPRWENYGQPIAFGSDGFGPAAEPRNPPAPALVDRTKNFIRRQVATPAKDYKRDCLPPSLGAKAQIKPIAPGAAPTKDTRPPLTGWKPARWCPPIPKGVSVGVRG